MTASQQAIGWLLQATFGLKSVGWLTAPTDSSLVVKISCRVTALPSSSVKSLAKLFYLGVNLALGFWCGLRSRFYITSLAFLCVSCPSCTPRWAEAYNPFRCSHPTTVYSSQHVILYVRSVPDIRPLLEEMKCEPSFQLKRCGTVLVYLRVVQYRTYCYAGGAGGGVLSCLLALSHVIVDHASLSRRSAVFTPTRDLKHLAAHYIFSVSYIETFCVCDRFPVSPSVAIYL